MPLVFNNVDVWNFEARRQLINPAPYRPTNLWKLTHSGFNDPVEIIWTFQWSNLLDGGSISSSSRVQMRFNLNQRFGNVDAYTQVGASIHSPTIFVALRPHPDPGAGERNETYSTWNPFNGNSITNKFNSSVAAIQLQKRVRLYWEPLTSSTCLHVVSFDDGSGGGWVDLWNGAGYSLSPTTANEYVPDFYVGCNLSVNSETCDISVTSITDRTFF